MLNSSVMTLQESSRGSALSIISISVSTLQVPGGSASDTCFKLFGFDIFIDADLKPWLLEVKILALVSP